MLEDQLSHAGIARIGIEHTSCADSELVDFGLQLSCDLIGIEIRLEPHRLSNLDRYLKRTGDPFSRLLNLEEAVDPNGNYGDFQIVYQQPDSRAERKQLAISCVAAFGKNQNAVAAVDRFSGESKAVAEPSFAGQREKIEKRHAEKPLDRIKYSEE